MCLPLIALVAGLIVQPFGYALYLSLLNKAETRFIGLGNFTFLFTRETFWLVVRNSCLFALTAVAFKAFFGFVLAHLINAIPLKRQRLWRGLMLVPWVMPPALSTLVWLWMFDPAYSVLNWILGPLGIEIPWLSDPFWARTAVIVVNIWIGSPFFMIMYLAGLKSVPADLYEAAEIDGASWWQKMLYVTLPMMRNIMAVTTLFSIIVTFANFDIVRVLTNGGPRSNTDLFGTWSFKLGIEAGDFPLAAGVSLFMFPALAVLAFFILRNVRQRAVDL
jgi:multiple sugar transport system permease protein